MEQFHSTDPKFLLVTVQFLREIASKNKGGPYWYNLLWYLIENDEKSWLLISVIMVSKIHTRGFSFIQLIRDGLLIVTVHTPTTVPWYTISAHRTVDGFLSWTPQPLKLQAEVKFLTHTHTQTYTTTPLPFWLSVKGHRGHLGFKIIQQASRSGICVWKVAIMSPA